MDLISHLEKLNYFMAVAESGSFREASRRLRIAQPAISRSIKILEEELQKSLFIRGKKGIELTEVGHKLVIFTKKLNSSIANLDAEIMGLDNKIEGRLKVGTFESLSIYLWPSLINQIRRSYPKLSIDLLTNNGKVLRQQLLDGSINMTLDVEPIPDANVDIFELYADEYKFYLSKDSVFKKRGPVKLEDVIDLPIIYAPKALSIKKESLKDQLVQLGISAKHLTYELDTFEAVKAMVVGNLGIGVIPKKVIQKEFASRKVRELDIIELRRLTAKHRICISVTKEQVAWPKIRAAIEVIQKTSLDI